MAKTTAKAGGDTLGTHDLGFRELQGDVALFLEWGKVRAELRERYRRFACARCKSLDRGKALADGIDPTFAARVGKLTVDAFTTRDLQDVLARPLFDALDRRFPGKMRAVPVPDTRYVVVVPRRAVEPPRGPVKPGRDSIFRVPGSRCKACGRYPETVYRPENVRLPRGGHVLPIVLQNGGWHVPVTAWVIDDAVREFVEKGKWKGVRVTKNFYGKRAAFHERAKRRQTKQTPENNSWLKMLKDSGQL